MGNSQPTTKNLQFLPCEKQYPLIFPTYILSLLDVLSPHNLNLFLFQQQTKYLIAWEEQQEGSLDGVGKLTFLRQADLHSSLLLQPKWGLGTWLPWKCVKWFWGAMTSVSWRHYINQESLLHFLNTMSDRENKRWFWQPYMVFSVLWPKGQQVWGIISLGTTVHYLVSKALAVQDFASYRVRMASQRAGPVKSLLYSCSSQVLLRVTGRCRLKISRECELKIWNLPRGLVHGITKSMSHSPCFSWALLLHPRVRCVHVFRASVAKGELNWASISLENS